MRILSLVLLAGLCGSAHADFTLASFQRGVYTEAANQNIEYFTDRDESTASKTKVLGQIVATGNGGKCLRLRFDIAPNPTLGYQYGGFAIPLDGKNVAQYADLVFYLRSAKAEVPDLEIGLRNKANDRDKVSLRDYIQTFQPNRWVKVSIPMTDFKLLRTSSMLEQMDSVSFSLEGGQAILDFAAITMSGVRAGAPEAELKIPPRVRRVWPKGHAVWCYHDKDTNIAQIKAYNATAVSPHRILYVFPWTGSLVFKAGGESILDWEPEEALYYSEKLGPGYEIHPIVDASSKGFELLTPAEIEDLATRLAAKVNADPRFAGLHLDIEPNNSILYAFLAALRRHTHKPISMAVSRWSPETFEYADAVAYMMYDISDNPRQYGKIVNKNLYDFMRDAAGVGGQVFIGMPAVASHSEYTYKREKSDGAVIQSGYRMEDFMDWAFKGVDKYATGDFKDAYVGMGVWGLLGNDSMSNNDDPYDYFPAKISDQSWAYFRKPLQE